MPSDDELVTRAAYDLVAQDYAATFPDLSAETPADRALLGSFAESVERTARVLDVGCGTGRVAAHLSALGLRPIGVDLSPGMLAQGRALHPDVPVVVGALSRLPFATASVSGALAWYSLIHTAPADLSAAVAEVARVLAVGAPFLVAFQAGAGERVERTEAFGLAVRRINYRHDVEVVVEVLAAHGLEVGERVVREPAGPYETTPQAFVLGLRAQPQSAARWSSSGDDAKPRRS